MAHSVKGKFVQTVVVIDPDTNGEVSVDLYKLDGGGMIGIDASFIETGEPIYSCFDKGVKIADETFL